MKKLFTLTGLVLMFSLAGFSNTRHFPNADADSYINCLHKIRKISQQVGLKSVEVAKQRLDSVVAPRAKYIYSYDSKGNLLLDEKFIRDTETSPWTGEEHTEYSYDADGYPEFVFMMEWDDSANKWTNSMRNTLSYDSGKRLAVWLIAVWNSDKEKWEDQMKSEISYVGDSDVASKSVIKIWDDASSSWVSSGSVEFTYDSNQYLILEERDFFGTKSKLEYTYNDKQNLIKSEQSNWDATGSQWIPDSKSEYTYTSDGKDHESFDFEWDINSGAWERIGKVEYFYDTDGNMIKRIDSFPEGIDSWENGAKEEYVCDNTYSVSDLILPEDCEFYGNQIHQVIEVNYYSWNGSSNDWDFGGPAVLYYSEHDMTAAKELSGQNMRVFPNPATGFVTITFPQNSNSVQFELFDMQGHKVLAREVVNQENVSLKGLSEGLYFYNLISDQEKVSGKLIKQ